jgi:hypothetical protein
MRSSAAQCQKPLSSSTSSYFAAQKQQAGADGLRDGKLHDRTTLIFLVSMSIGVDLVRTDYLARCNVADGLSPNK